MRLQLLSNAFPVGSEGSVALITLWVSGAIVILICVDGSDLVHC